MDNKLVLITEDHATQFIKDFNDSLPSKEFMKSCEKAGRLFDRSSSNDSTDREDTL